VGAEAARRALRVDGSLPGPVRGAHVVELDRPANIAAGTVPWGVAGPLAALDPTTSTTRVAEGDDTAVAHALVTAVDRPVVVVVRDPQRRPGQAAALQTLLGARPDAVVVDMGWPTDPTDPTGTADPADRPGPAAARITTYGASRASGEAVAGLLAGVPTTPGNTSTTTTEGRTSRG
jgi:beta-N-acetylhexosaminidase